MLVVGSTLEYLVALMYPTPLGIPRLSLEPEDYIGQYFSGLVCAADPKFNFVHVLMCSRSESDSHRSMHSRFHPLHPHDLG